MNVKIESGIAMPPKHVGAKKPLTLPWADMHIGDSFQVFDEPSLKVAERERDRAAKALGMKFEMRRVENGVRFWRVK